MENSRSSSSRSAHKRKHSGSVEHKGKKIRKSESQHLRLTELPEVPILKIASCLSGKDLLTFSHLNRQMFNICNSSSSLWRNSLKAEGLTFSNLIREKAKEKAGSEGQPNVDKLTYLYHVRTKANWKSGRIARSMTLPALQGHPGNFLVLLIIYRNLQGFDRVCRHGRRGRGQGFCNINITKRNDNE